MSVEGLAAWLGLAVHVMVGVFYLNTPVIAPMGTSVALVLIWTVLLGVVLLLWRDRSWTALLVPPLALAIWIGTVLLGEALARRAA